MMLDQQPRAVLGNMDMSLSLQRAVQDSDSNTMSNANSSSLQMWDITSISGVLPPLATISFFKPQVEIQTFARCPNVHKKYTAFYHIGSTVSEEPSVTGILSNIPGAEDELDPKDLIRFDVGI